MKKLLLLVTSLSLLVTACGTLDPAGPYEGNKVAYTYDLAITTCADVVEAFLTWEKSNRALLLVQAPEAVAAAKKIRVEYPVWSKSAAALSKAYQSVPSKETETQLVAAIRVLRQMMIESQSYMTRATGV